MNRQTEDMGKLKWYKRDPTAALEGMKELTLEECGAYNRVLDLIYAREGNVADNDIRMARVLGCDPRKWRRIKATLIELGKLFVHNGKLHNKRADIEISKAGDRLDEGLIHSKCGATSRQTTATSSMADIPKPIKKQSLSGVTTTTTSRKNPPTPLEKGGLGFSKTQPKEEGNGRQRKWSKRYTSREAIGEAFDYLDCRDQENGENGGDENSG